MTYRPLAARVVAAVSAGSLLAVIVAVAVALPASVRAGFSLAQNLTLALVLGAALAVLFGIGRTRVRTDDRGIHVVNGYRRHDLSWAEAVQVSLGRGAPWAVLDTSAGNTLPLMAIQNADGERALLAVRRLRAELRDRAPDDP